jgi:antitoxin component YwqK of YwqJK toxin-antitoxin module
MPLVNYSGAMRIELNYRLNRKNGIVKLYLKQTQIAEEFFKNQMIEKIQQEKNFFRESSGRKLIEQIREQFLGLTEKYKTVLHKQIKKETERIFLVDKKRNTLQNMAFTTQMIMTGIVIRNH